MKVGGHGVNVRGRVSSGARCECEGHVSSGVVTSGVLGYTTQNKDYICMQLFTEVG